MRTEEKSEYVEAVLGLLGETHPDLEKSLKSMKTQNLVYLAKSLSDLLGKSMPILPTRTKAQTNRLSFLYTVGIQNESDPILERTVVSI
jgi:hypothetical protein